MNAQAQPLGPSVENRCASTGMRDNHVASRVPILLSSLVFPGLGQMVQRRWYSGVFFAAGFLVSLVVLVLPVIEALISVYGMADIDTAFDVGPDAARRLAGQIGIRFCWAIAIYVINVIDVGLAEMRSRTKQK